MERMAAGPVCATGYQLSAAIAHSAVSLCSVRVQHLFSYQKEPTSLLLRLWPVLRPIHPKNSFHFLSVANISPHAFGISISHGPVALALDPHRYTDRRQVSSPFPLIPLWFVLLCHKSKPPRDGLGYANTGSHSARQIRPWGNQGNS
jgi:hypothetical protein